MLRVWAVDDKDPRLKRIPEDYEGSLLERRQSRKRFFPPTCIQALSN